MRIASRFNGPPTSAHGGVACGLFAAAVDPMVATVRLVAPPPLEEDLGVRDEDDGSRTIVARDGAPVASVRPWTMPADMTAFDPVGADDLAAATDACLADRDPDSDFATCFGCGQGRPDGDGLALCAGRIPGTDLYGTEWIPEGTPGRAVEPWWVWAAVDCPSGFGLLDRWVDVDAGQAQLLGELSLAIAELPRAGTGHQILSRPVECAGRKMTGDVAVIAPTGATLARGRATWIIITP